jgi:hypothetical protein
MTLLDVVIADLQGHLPSASREELESRVSGWELHPYIDSDALTAVMMVKGTEFHLVSTDGFKLNRKLARNSLEPHMQQYGFLTTRVLRDDKANQRFNRLFGFKPTWADDKFQYFILTELPFGDKSCQQSQ